MLKITKKVEYALISLKYIWEEKSRDELTTAREICSKFNLPFDTTSKVMQSMNNAGIVHSEKGIKGGYALYKNLSEVSYLELVQIVDPKSNDDEFCQSNKGLCELYSNCNIVKPIDKLKVWFSKTNWRPQDVKKRFPNNAKLNNLYNQILNHNPEKWHVYYLL